MLPSEAISMPCISKSGRTHDRHVPRNEARVNERILIPCGKHEGKSGAKKGGGGPKGGKRTREGDEYTCAVEVTKNAQPFDGAQQAGVLAHR